MSHKLAIWCDKWLVSLRYPSSFRCKAVKYNVSTSDFLNWNIVDIFTISSVQFSSVQSSSVAQSSTTLCDPMNRSMLGLPVHQQLPESTQTDIHRVGDAIQPPLLPPIPPSIRVFSNESTLCMRWPKNWSFRVSIILSKEHPGLISFRMDCLDLLAVQGTLESLLQHHSSKASIFGAQLSSQSDSHIHTWPPEKP